MNSFAVVVFVAAVAYVNGGVLPVPAASSHASYTQHVAPVGQHYAAPLLSKTLVAAPVIQKTYLAAPKAVEVEHYAPAQYDFEYSVHDPTTGDIKEQKESRQGDAVQGSYSFIEADGSRRVVEYTADEHNGFNAVVHREQIKSAAPVAPVKYAVPAVPVKYAAPAVPAATYVSYSAPSHVYHH